MRPRGRWKRKLRDRISRPAASRLDRDRLALDALVAAAVEREPDPRPPPTSRRRRRRAADAPPRQRMWNVGRAVDADALRLEVRVEAFHPELAADAALLDAAERALGEPDVVGVDPDVADAEPPRQPDRPVQVARPDRAPEAEVAVVGERERLAPRRSNGMTDRTGPKISSRAIVMDGSTSSKIVGAM